MKVIITLLIILGVSVLSAPTSLAQGSLETELLNVMQAKSQAYFAADTDTWQKYWIKDAHSSRSVVDKFDYSGQVGW